MIFNSTLLENLEKLSQKYEIKEIVIDEYENLSWNKISQQINKFAKQFKKDISEIKFYRKNNISIDEFGHTEDRLIFYYEALESDKEYNARIEELQKKDLQESIKEVRRFHVCITQKEQLRKLYDKLVKHGPYKGLIDKNFQTFLDIQSEEEKIKKSYNQGYDNGRQEVLRLKKQLKQYI